VGCSAFKDLHRQGSEESAEISYEAEGLPDGAWIPLRPEELLEGGEEAAEARDGGGTREERFHHEVD